MAETPTLPTVVTDYCSPQARLIRWITKIHENRPKQVIFQLPKRWGYDGDYAVLLSDGTLLLAEWDKVIVKIDMTPKTKK